MSFIDTRLNDRYRYGFVGGPRWSTLVVEMANGRNRRKKQWSMPHHEFTADFATFSEQEKSELLNAFMAAGGAFSSFRFRDWNDWVASDQEIGTGNGTTAPMQLVRNYRFGATTYTRPITLPLNAVIRDIDNNVIAAAIDPLTGMATPAAPWPIKALRWTGQFDVRVRFAEDFNPFTAAAEKIRECTVRLLEDFG